ncbi:MAG: type II toxin-antitoxin system YafQ family toxin [Anaerolineaceae bacterium]|nr:type II toxin-antitoxin system YafQ family toxin [Anaerolineaceae bacterium]
MPSIWIWVPAGITHGIGKPQAKSVRFSDFPYHGRTTGLFSVNDIQSLPCCNRRRQAYCFRQQCEGLYQYGRYLSGNYKGTRECHTEPDWLLVYEICGEVLVLMLYRLGTHSELFKN